MKSYKLIALSTLTAILVGVGVFSFSRIQESAPVDAIVETKGIPSGYYDNADTSTASKLYKSLITIAKKGYQTYSYDNLETRMREIDWDASGVDDSTKVGRMVDIYSNATKYGKNDNKGSYSGEGDCWNKEHLIPKSWWGSNKNGPNNEGCDGYNMFPTDGYINNMRSSYPFGETIAPTKTSKNGFSKLGPSSNTGCTGYVFEPNDKYKGDIARAYFYFATKNQNSSGTAGSTYTSNNGSITFSGSEEFMLTDYAASLFYKWHKLDPVSDWERLRCDQAYASQGNRNPYIDHPEYADIIWGGQTPTEVKITALTLSPLIVNLEEGGTSTITPTILPTNATNKTLTWTCDDTSIATVNNGVVTGVKAGSCYVTATTTDGSGLFGTVAVNVNAKPVTPGTKVESITLDKTNISIEISGNETITPTVLPASAENKTVKWTSNNTSVATVSDKGVVTGIGSGTATVSCESTDGSGIIATCAVTVTGSYPIEEIININKNSPRTSEVSSYAWYDICKNADVTKIGQMYCYSTSTEIFMQFNPSKTGKGLFTNVNRTGLTKIVFYENSASSNTAWKVRFRNDQLTTSNYLNGDVDATISVTPGEEITYNVPSSFYTYGYFSLEPQSLSKVSYFQLVYSTIEKVDVTGVSLSDSSISLLNGESKMLSASVLPTNATNKNVSWSSNNPNVATVENGLVKAVGAGNATITVTTEDGNKTATCNVTVSNPVIHVTSVTLDKSQAGVNIGETLNLVATVLPENATDKSITWVSANPFVATVSLTTGQVKGISKGTTTVSAIATDGLITATCTVTVIDPTPTVIHVDSVSLNKTSATLNKGETDTLIATVLPENATDKSVTWESSDINVATVNNGVVTAVSAGNATITVTTEDGNKTATYNVTVNNPSPTPIPVTNISVNNSITIKPGATSQLIYSVTPDNATNKKVIFTSNDTSIATVNENGVVTGVKNGQCVVTITALDGSGVTAQCVVTVSDSTPVKGCGGSVVASSAILCTISLLGAGLLIIRKKRK